MECQPRLGVFRPSEVMRNPLQRFANARGRLDRVDQGPLRGPARIHVRAEDRLVVEHRNQTWPLLVQRLCRKRRADPGPARHRPDQVRDPAPLICRCFLERLVRQGCEIERAPVSQYRRRRLPGYARVDQHRHRQVFNKQHVWRRRRLELQVQLSPVSLTDPPLPQQILDSLNVAVEPAGPVDQIHEAERNRRRDRKEEGEAGAAVSSHDQRHR
jgi:hypothetical protein